MTTGTADGFYFIITIPQAVLPLGGFFVDIHFLRLFRIEGENRKIFFIFFMNFMEQLVIFRNFIKKRYMQNFFPIAILHNNSRASKQKRKTQVILHNNSRGSKQERKTQVN